MISRVSSATVQLFAESQAAAPKPKAVALKPTASAGVGMSALLNKVEAVGKKKLVLISVLLPD